MTVEQVDVVDAISVEKATARVALTLFDHLRWDDKGHVTTLENKLRLYVHFVESGELHEKYSDAKGRTPFIRAVIKYRPNADGSTFLEAARVALRQHDLEFEYGPAPGLSYEDES
jgi:hypothetical protein